MNLDESAPEQTWISVAARFGAGGGRQAGYLIPSRCQFELSTHAAPADIRCPNQNGPTKLRGECMHFCQTKLRCLAIVVGLVGMMPPCQADARDAARDLRRLKGYCITDATTVAEVLTSSDGEKYLRLSNGSTFKVDALLLDPLPLTDVIIFTKPLPNELIEQLKAKLPNLHPYVFKLLIDNEVFDVQQVDR